MNTKKNDCRCGKNTQTDCCGKTVTKTCTETTQYGWAKCPTDGTAGMTYVGQRYITKFHDPIKWSADVPYEQNEAVQYNGFTYLSKKPVPVGVQIDNDEFWLVWADPNAQMEELRRLTEQYAEDVQLFDSRITENSEAIQEEVAAREEAIKEEVAAREEAIQEEATARERAIQEEATARERAIQEEATAREEAIQELRDKIDIIPGSVTPVLLGILNYSATDGNYGHVGAICDYNRTQVIISNHQNSQNEEDSDDGIIRTANIAQNLDNKNSVRADIGHANSIATNGQTILVAPLTYHSGKSASVLVEVAISGAVLGTHETPETLYAVSYDWAAKKWYGAATNDKIYSFDFSNGIQNFTEECTLAYEDVAAETNWRQDMAVYDGIIYINTVTNNLYSTHVGNSYFENSYSIASIDASGGFILGEFDGIEFNENGDLLTVFDSTYGDELATTCFVCTIPLNNRFNSLMKYAVPKRFTVNTYVTTVIDADNTKLFENGFTFKNLCVIHNLSGNMGINRIRLASDIHITKLKNENVRDIVIDGRNHTLEIDNPIQSRGNITFIATKLKAPFPIVGMEAFPTNLAIKGGSVVTNTGQGNSWFNDGAYGCQLLLTGSEGTHWPRMPLYTGSNFYPQSGNVSSIIGNYETINNHS